MFGRLIVTPIRVTDLGKECMFHRSKAKQSLLLPILDGEQLYKENISIEAEIILMK